MKKLTILLLLAVFSLTACNVQINSDDVGELIEDRNDNIIKTNQIEEVDKKIDFSNNLIHILSPKKDTVLKVGEVFSIKWKNAILKTDTLSLKLEGQSEQGDIIYEKLIDDIAIDGRDTKGSYEWTVSYDWISNDKSPVTTYRVKLCHSYDCDLEGYSEFFQIEGNKTPTEYDVAPGESTLNLKTYSDDKLLFSFQYSDDLLMDTDIPHNKEGVVLYNEEYQGDKGFGWTEIGSGFKIMIKNRNVQKDWWQNYGKAHYGEIAGTPFGEKVVKEIVNIGDYEAAKRVEEGLGFLQDWQETHTLKTIVIPNTNNIVDISFMTKKSDYDKYIDIFDQVVQSIEFLDEE